MALKGRSGRPSLSDRLRGMRFMREREDADLKEKQAQEQKEREAAAQWVIHDPVEHDLSTIIIVDDAGADPPVAARQSYGQFNVAVERRMPPEGVPSTDAKPEDNFNQKQELKTEPEPIESQRQQPHQHSTPPRGKSEDNFMHLTPSEKEEGELEDSPVQQPITPASDRHNPHARHRASPSQRRDQSFNSAQRRGKKRSYSGPSPHNQRKKFKSPGNNNRPLFKR